MVLGIYNMTELNYLIKIKTLGLITEQDRPRIWKMYKKTFGIHPHGKITCGNCIINSFETLYKYHQLKQLIY